MRVMSTRYAMRAVAGGVIAAACFGSVQAASAVTPTQVPCNAIALASAISGGGGLLRLSPYCLYILKSPLPGIGADLTILGNDATVERSYAPATPAFGIFTITSASTVAISDLTLRNGDSAGNGGAIDNTGAANLTVSYVTLRGNSAAQGGAIYNDSSGQATVRISTFTANNAASGGAIDNAGTLTLTSDAFSANTAAGQGGAVLSTDGLTAAFLTLRHNQASAGGGIYATGSMTITSSVLLSNSATGTSGEADGGGIYNASNAGLRGLTLRNNMAGFDGGGIYASLSPAQQMTVIRTVILGNEAGNDGGGIFNANGNPLSVPLTNSPVTKNIPDNCAPSGSVGGCTG